MMYDLSIFIYFSRSSLRTNKQTHTQTNRHRSLINIEGLVFHPSPITAAVISFPVITHSCSPFQFPIPVSRPRSRSRSPFPVPVGATLHTITTRRPLPVTQNLQHNSIGKLDILRESRFIRFQSFANSYLPTRDVSLNILGECDYDSYINQNSPSKKSRDFFKK